ncbi:MAG: RluA family pseudouridine synthase [Planctomycetes bacterium]|nr:RluA family pseudouridine synthase [Planctomycetota bacterium]
MAKKKIEIIHEDESLLVVNKPSGISVTKDRSGDAQLLDYLSEQMEAKAVSELRLVHRLDKATSGVMILAKNAKTQSKYSSYFEKRLVKKTYLALVSGYVAKDRGSINARIIRDSKRPGQMHLTRKRGKGAQTRWRLLANFGSMSLLAVQPVTGRTHQIRIHLPSIALPLVIDPLYGNKGGLLLSDFKRGYNLGKGRQEKPLIERLTLHAYQLEFTEKQEGLPDCFIAGLDKSFKTTIKMLAKHNAEGMDAFLNEEDFEKIVKSQKLD